MEKKKEEIITNDPITSLRNIIFQYKSPRFEILPPFTGGFVGYFSYDFFKI
jgi:anthranilate synthase component 1